MAEEPPSFHDAIVGMTFRDKKKKVHRLKRASSAESVLENLEKGPMKREPALAVSNQTLVERTKGNIRLGLNVNLRNSVDVIL